MVPVFFSGALVGLIVGMFLFWITSDEKYYREGKEEYQENYYRVCEEKNDLEKKLDEVKRIVSWESEKCQSR